MSLLLCLDLTTKLKAVWFLSLTIFFILGLNMKTKYFNTVSLLSLLISGLPDICESILEKWLKEGFIKHKPDQLTINQYEPGHGEYFFFYNSSHKFHNLVGYIAP